MLSVNFRHSQKFRSWLVPSHRLYSKLSEQPLVKRPTTRRGCHKVKFTSKRKKSRAHICNHIVMGESSKFKILNFRNSKKNLQYVFKILKILTLNNQLSSDKLKINNEAIITCVCLIQSFEADFLWKVSLKMLNSGIILKTFTHVGQVVQSILSLTNWWIHYKFIFIIKCTFSRYTEYFIGCLHLLNFWYLLSCQPGVTVTSCFVYTVIRDL